MRAPVLLDSFGTKGRFNPTSNMLDLAHQTKLSKERVLRSTFRALRLSRGQDFFNQARIYASHVLRMSTMRCLTLRGLPINNRLTPCRFRSRPAPDGAYNTLPACIIGTDRHHCTTLSLQEGVSVDQHTVIHHFVSHIVPEGSVQRSLSRPIALWIVRLACVVFKCPLRSIVP